MAKYDIAVNITLHSEGALLFKTFKSVAQCIKQVRSDYPKIKVQVNIAMDQPTDETVQYEKKYLGTLSSEVDNTNSYVVDYGDPSLSRNFLISKSNAKYIQIFDGDDLFTRNYLSEAYKEMLSHREPICVVPEYLLDMDEWTGLIYSSITRYISTKDRRQILTNLYSRNLYQSEFLVDARIFQHIEYKERGSSYCYEDYCFIMDVISSGFEIAVAKNTIKVYRRKMSGSVLLSDDSSKKCLAPTRLLQPDVFGELPHIDSSEFVADDYRMQPAVDARNQYMKLYNSHFRNFLLHAKYSLIEFAQSGCSAARVLKSRLQVNRMDSNGLGYDRLHKFGVTDNMLNMLRELNEIEPLVVYNSYFVKNAPCLINLEPTALDDIYRKLCRINGIGDVTDILLVPHISQGGADKAMIDLCKALTKDGERKVLAIATAPGEPSPWADKMNEIDGVIFLQRDYDFPVDKIDDSDLETMLLRVIQNWSKLQTLTVMNSAVGYNLIADWGDEIKKYTKIIVHSWCYCMNELGMAVEPFKLSSIYDKLDCLVTDGTAYKKQLMDINGWDGEIINVVPLPIKDVPIKKSYNINRRVMYAGRFGSQKRIDLLLKRISDYGRENINLVFYGSVDKSDAMYDVRNDMEIIDTTPNAQYCGPFNDFSKLPIDDVDVLVLPTQYEGMPNIVLEALKANLFVIAGDAGSISNVIVDGKNGYLVKDSGNADAYYDAIVKFYNNKQLSPQERESVNERVLACHGKLIYEKTIREIYGVTDEVD